MKQPIQMDVLVKTESLYVAILDEGSVANRSGYMSDSLRAGRRKAKRDGQEQFFGLFVFNEQLMQAAKDGELLAWTLLFDGVFRAEVHVVPEFPVIGSQSSDNLGSVVSQATLFCPTGRLMISCLGRLGQSQSSFIVVEPGSYRVSIERNDDEEHKHIFLSSPCEYPNEDGPDWKIKVQRLTIDA